MAISILLTPCPTSPSRNKPETFRQDADDAFDWKVGTFVPEMNTVINDLNAVIQNLFVATSDTSVTVGTGAKTWTVNEENLAFGIGMALRVSDTADPTTNWMEGIVTAYSKASKSLSMWINTSEGAGTNSAWTFTHKPQQDFNRIRAWSSLSGAVSLPFLTSHGGLHYRLTENIADATAHEPGVSNKWKWVGHSTFVELTSDVAEWNKDPGASMVAFHVIGGGGGGSDYGNGGGASGGQGISAIFRAEDVPANLTITIGDGGNVSSDGGDTTVGALLKARGGHRGRNISTAFSTPAGSREAWVYISDFPFQYCYNGESGYGGSPSETIRGGGHSSVGGGGGGGGDDGTGGESALAGNGGNAYEAGQAPGGGGGRNGAGAKGAVRIWQW